MKTLIPTPYSSLSTLRLSGVAVLAVMMTACGASDATEPETPPAIEDATTHDMSHEVPDVDDASSPDEGDKSMRQAGSHVHGKADLALALEGSMLAVELETPLFNLVGFEHAPETDEQKVAVERAEAALSDADVLFVFNADAGCIPDPVLPVSLIDEDGHDDQPDPEDVHAADEDAHDHEDLVLPYSFTCESPRALRSLSVSLFDEFENLSEVEAVYLGESITIVRTLDQNQSTLDLRD